MPMPSHRAQDVWYQAWRVCSEFPKRTKGVSETAIEWPTDQHTDIPVNPAPPRITTMCFLPWPLVMSYLNVAECTIRIIGWLTKLCSTATAAELLTLDYCNTERMQGGTAPTECWSGLKFLKVAIIGMDKILLQTGLSKREYRRQRDERDCDAKARHQ
jgi:hypothetical protein